VTEPIIVSGPPGAGKSTVAALVAEAFPTVVLVPGDAFFTFWSRGFLDPWRPESRRQNETILTAAGAAVGAYSRGDCQVVFDGVLGPWLLPAFLAGAALPSVHYVVLLPPVDVCLARVAGRPGHPFADPAATRQMHAEFARADIDPRHLVADGVPDAGAAATGVLARVRNGSARLGQRRSTPRRSRP
jgi:cytidylate kinase